MLLMMGNIVLLRVLKQNSFENFIYVGNRCLLDFGLGKADSRQLSLSIVDDSVEYKVKFLQYIVYIHNFAIT